MQTAATANGSAPQPPSVDAGAAPTDREPEPAGENAPAELDARDAGAPPDWLVTEVAAAGGIAVPATDGVEPEVIDAGPAPQ